MDREIWIQRDTTRSGISASLLQIQNDCPFLFHLLSNCFTLQLVSYKKTCWQLITFKGTCMLEKMVPKCRIIRHDVTEAETETETESDEPDE